MAVLHIIVPTIFRLPTLARSGQSFADPSPVTSWFAPVFPRSYNYRLRVVPPFRRSFQKKKISERKVDVGAPREGLEKKDPFFSGSFLHKFHALFCFQWFFFRLAWRNCQKRRDYSSRSITSTPSAFGYTQLRKKIWRLKISGCVGSPYLSITLL